MRVLFLSVPVPSDIVFSLLFALCLVTLSLLFSSSHLSSSFLQSPPYGLAQDKVMGYLFQDEEMRYFFLVYSLLFLAFLWCFFAWYILQFCRLSVYFCRHLV